MPARSELNPGDIPVLLPYLGLVNKVDGQFRWRLTKTAVADKIGSNLTGTVVGSQITNAPESVAALQSIFERTFASAHPVFATGEHKTKWGIHNMSLLVLPLSDDGTTVNMAVLTRIARFNFEVTASVDLKRLCLKGRDVIDIDSAVELKKRCLDWERYCDDQRRRAVIAE